MRSHAIDPRMDARRNMTVPDEEKPFDARELRNVMADFASRISDLGNLLEDKSHRVDAYNVTSSASEVNAAINLQPEYEVSEIIESVLIIGPTGTPTFSLQLGKRFWNLTLPASGVLVIAPVRISLNRNDPRILTPTTPGDWALELMGFANYTESYRSLA